MRAARGNASAPTPTSACASASWDAGSPGPALQRCHDCACERRRAPREQIPELASETLLLSQLGRGRRDGSFPECRRAALNNRSDQDRTTNNAHRRRPRATISPHTLRHLRVALHGRARRLALPATEDHGPRHHQKRPAVMPRTAPFRVALIVDRFWPRTAPVVLRPRRVSQYGSVRGFLSRLICVLASAAGSRVVEPTSSC